MDEVKGRRVTAGQIKVGSYRILDLAAAEWDWLEAS